MPEYVCNFVLYIQTFTYRFIMSTSENYKIYLEKRNNKQGELITANVPIFIYIKVGKKRTPYYTGYRCNLEQWNNETSEMKKNQVNKEGLTSSRVNSGLDILKGQISNLILNNPKEDINFIKSELNKLQGKETKSTQEQKELTFYDYFQNYIDSANFSTNRKNQMAVTMNKLKKYYPNITFETFSDVTLEDFRKKIKKTISTTSTNGELRRLRAFFKYAIMKKITSNYPFEKFKLEKDVYGEPVFITIKERNELLNFDLSKCTEEQLKGTTASVKTLELVRDMFILHCFIGARVGDFVRLSKANLNDNGFIEYYENKKVDDPERKLISVPLTASAKNIIEKYNNTAGERLFPFISEQKYNLYLKELFLLAGLTRKVTVLDKHTKKEVLTPLNTLVSSHMARKTFIGNLYKKTKDSVICSMSGHVEGSKAFARYYKVDNDDKINAVNLTE